jgi:hypothetical protein
VSIVAHSRGLAATTIVVSLSLLLSYGINRNWFPEGPVFVVIYFWVLAMIWVVPLLLVTEAIVVVRLIYSETTDRRSLLVWNVLALVAGVIVCLTVFRF